MNHYDHVGALGDVATLEAAKAAKAKAKVIADAKAAAKAQIEAKVKALKDRGAADARTGSYNPPAPAPPPDFDTANYQAGWQTVKPLPSGVPPQNVAPASTGAPSTFPIVPVAIAAAGLAAILLMRKK